MDWKMLSEDGKTAALEIPGVGCIVGHTGVSTASESMVFVPGVRVIDGTLVKETRAQPQLGGERSVLVLDEEPDY